MCDWDGKNIPSGFFERDYQDIMEFFQHLHGSGSYAYGVNMYVDAENSQWLGYFWECKCYWAALSKEGGWQKNFSSFRVSSLLGNYTVDLREASFFSQDNGTVVVLLDGMDVVERSGIPLSGQWKEVEEDSNPVLLIVKPV